MRAAPASCGQRPEYHDGSHYKGCNVRGSEISVTNATSQPFVQRRGACHRPAVVVVKCSWCRRGAHGVPSGLSFNLCHFVHSQFYGFIAKRRQESGQRVKLFQTGVQKITRRGTSSRCLPRLQERVRQVLDVEVFTLAAALSSHREPLWTSHA